MSGGGFGQPPGGGGFGPPSGSGGGFGPPSASPPAGGGFGQPSASPPAGGGFGPPGGSAPGGGGFGHGGGAPPGGGGGGEGPLAHIPFTPEDDANLSGTARFARFAAIAAIAAGLLQMVAQLIGGLMRDLPASNMAGQACGGAVVLGITALLAYFLFRVGKAVDLVVKTDDADQLNLVDALKALRGYFIVKGIIYIIVILLFCTCFSLFFFMGAAVLGAMGMGG